MKVWLVTGLIASLGGLVLPESGARSQGPEVSHRRGLDAVHLRAERFYAGGVRALEAQRYREALDLLEKAVPPKGMSQNLLFNLAHAANH